jgi:hypothetical protein
VLIEAGWGQTVIGQFDIVDTDPTFADFEWHSVSMPFATSGVENQFRIMVRSQGVAGSVIHLDNFTIVPEPASLGILALGGIPLLRRRRHA